MTRPINWTAVVLAGGRGTRMGGRAKPQLVVDGKTLLTAVIDGLPTDVPVVVVGPDQPVPRAVVFCREQPPFGGPVAALAAALEVVRTETIGLVGADMPRAAELLTRLVAQQVGDSAVVPVDLEGRRQPLCCALPTRAVRSAIKKLGEPAGTSMRALIDQLIVEEATLSPSDAMLLRDIDVPGDLGSV